MTIDQKSVEIFVRALYDLLMLVCMYYTMVMQHGIRKDYERVYEQNQAVLELLQSLQAGTIQPLQPTISAIPAVVPRDLGHGTGYSLERQSLQLQAAVAWLKSNDRGLKLTTREAERLSGIPRNTINRAQHWIRNS